MSLSLSFQVKERTDVLEKIGAKDTILVQDAYYTDREARSIMLQCHVQFLSALNSQWWNALIAPLQGKLGQAGSTAALVNTETKEVLLGHHDKKIWEKVSPNKCLCCAQIKTLPKHNSYF